MIRKNKLVTILLIASMILIMIGCSKVSNNEGENISTESLSTTEIENHIPYINEDNGEIDNNIIDERYENVNKEELSYDPLVESSEDDNSEVKTQVYLADSIKNDTNYKSILLGFTYFLESNPSNLTYDEAIELVKKVLPDDIEKVNTVIDNEVNKEYIYYKSSKGNFRVGLCYGYKFNEENIEEVDKNLIIGIDYSKEIK